MIEIVREGIKRNALLKSGEVLRGLIIALETYLAALSPVFKGLTNKYIETCKKRKRGHRGNAKTYSFTAEIDDETLFKRLDEMEVSCDPPPKRPKLAPSVPQPNLYKVTALTDSIVASSKLQKPLEMLLPKELKKLKSKSLARSDLPKVLKQEIGFSTHQLSSLEVICQVQAKFIIAKTTSEPFTLVAVDQHAAHERILLERFQGQVPAQLKGEHIFEILKVSAYDIEQLKSKEQDLKAWNWEFTISRTDEVEVKKVPSFMGTALPADQLAVFAGQLGGCPQLMLR